MPQISPMSWILIIIALALVIMTVKETANPYAKPITETKITIKKNKSLKW